MELFKEDNDSSESDGEDEDEDGGTKAEPDANAAMIEGLLSKLDMAKRLVFKYKYRYIELQIRAEQLDMKKA